MRMRQIKTRKILTEKAQKFLQIKQKQEEAKNPRKNAIGIDLMI